MLYPVFFLVYMFVCAMIGWPCGFVTFRPFSKRTEWGVCYRVVFYTATSSDRRKKEAVVTVHSCSSNTPCLPASSIVVVCIHHYSPVPSLSNGVEITNNE